MNREREQKALEIVEAAQGLAGAARDAFVRDRCGEDDALRARVEQLLLVAEDTVDVVAEKRLPSWGASTRVSRRVRENGDCRRSRTRRAIERAGDGRPGSTRGVRFRTEAGDNGGPVHASHHF